MAVADQIEARALPRISPQARFVPAERLGDTPHAVVDGARLPATALALSHWPASGTPEALRDDTSALIVARYLDADPAGPEITAVTNNHYDEDGLLGLWMLLERPGREDPARALAIAAAEAGDFGTWSDPWAPRVALAAMAMAERATTPFPEVGRALARPGGGDPAGQLYLAILPHTGRLLADPERHRRLWEPEWTRVEADRALLEAGEAAIAERAEASLAVVRAPGELHDMALHPLTPTTTRTLTVAPDGRLVLRERYETWVDYASRRLAPRIDLSPLAARLQRDERNPVRWVYEGTAAIRARLHPIGARGRTAPSSLDPELVAEAVCEELARAEAR